MSREPTIARPIAPTGDLLTVRVTSLDGEGAALAHVEGESAKGQNVRVYGGVPGDLAVVEVLSRGRNATWTKLLRVVEQGPDRTPAPCVHARACGGCPWQAVSRPAQRGAKAERLRRLMDSSHNLRSLPSRPLRWSSRDFGFRTKVQMPVGGRPGALITGLYGPHSKTLVPIGECIVQHPLAESVRRAVLERLNEHRVAPWYESDASEGDASGELRTLLLRVSEHEAQVALILIVGDPTKRDWRALSQQLMGEIPHLASIGLNVGPTKRRPWTEHDSSRRKGAPEREHPRHGCRRRCRLVLPD
jgi:23S rRNA (uracil1939-C5)-methyltransferase